jgi:hypothetical protein
MAVNRYVLTATVTVAAGTPSTVVAGEPGTGGAAGFGNRSTTGGPLWPTTFLQGQQIMLDPAGALYTQIGAGNLALLTEAQETGGQIGVSN